MDLFLNIIVYAKEISPKEIAINPNLFITSHLPCYENISFIHILRLKRHALIEIALYTYIIPTPYKITVFNTISKQSLNINSQVKHEYMAYLMAITSISTKASLGSLATSKADRAG